MNEPRITDGSLEAQDTVLRFTQVPAFHHPVGIRVERRHGSTLFVATELDAIGGVKIGKPFQRRRGLVSDSAWAAVQQLIAASAFWRQPLVSPDDERRIVMDGGQWVFEARSADQYHVVVRHAGDSALRQLANLLLEVADLPSRGAVRGRVKNVRTGEPIAGALVAVGPWLLGWQRTDATGAFLVDFVPVGTWHLRVECPRPNGATDPRMPSPDAVVTHRDTTNVEIAADMRRCNLPPGYNSRPTVLSGAFTRGFDDGEFFPDPDAQGKPVLWGNDPTVRYAGVVFATEAIRASAASWPTTEVSRAIWTSFPCWRVVFRGELAGPRPDSVPNYRFVVDSILTVKPTQTRACSRAPAR